MATSTIMKKLSIFTVGAILIALGMGGAAQATVIDFDTDANGNSIDAPPNFLETTALTNLYAPLGVAFSGPGTLAGGAILDQLGNFGINALSGSNFLAFNRFASLSNGSLPTDPETIRFDTPISKFSIFASGGFESNTFQLEAFDINDVLIGTTAITTVAAQWGQLSFSQTMGNINRIVLTGVGIDNTFVYDNLSFTPASTSVPEPTSTLGVLAFGTFAALSLRRHKHQQKVTVNM